MATEYRLSPAQLAVWTRRAQFASADPMAELTAFAFGSTVDPNVFAATFLLLVERNPILQATIHERADGPRQYFEMVDPDRIVIRHSVADVPHGSRDQKARGLIDEFFRKPFSPEAGALAQLCLVDHGDGTTSGGARASQLLLNRRQWFSLWREFEKLYGEVLAGILAPQSVRAEHAGSANAVPDWEQLVATQWEQFDSRAADATQFWTSRIPSDLPPLALPTNLLTANARYAAMRGDLAAVHVDESLALGLRQAALDVGRGIDVVLHGAFAALLYRYGDNTQIPIARYLEIPEGSGVGPDTAGPMPVLVQVNGDTSFSDLTARVAEELQAVEAWADVPLDLLRLPDRVGVDNGVDPAFQAGFRFGPSLDNRLAGSQLRVSSVRQFRPTTDLELRVTDYGTHLTIGIHYCTDLFDPRVIDAMCSHFRHLLRAFVDNPYATVGTPELLGPGERRRILADWNDTDRPYPDTATIVDLFEQTVDRHPDRIATTFRGEHQSFAELDNRATQLARALLAKQVKVGDRVALMLDRSPHMVEAIVATLMVGASYVPLETDLPKKRVEELLEISGAVCMITDEVMRERLPEGFPMIAPGVDDISFSTDPLPQLNTSPEDVAYVLFTSGSTGKPKAAQVRTGGVVNLVYGLASMYDINQDDRVMLKTPYSHDISISELFLPLFVGGRIVIAEPDGHRDPDYLAQLIAEQRVSVIHFVPTMLAEFIRSVSGGEPLPLKHVFVAGEALTKELASQLREFDRWRSYNAYGATEASDYSTIWEIVDDTTAISPIGVPLPNVRLYILGPNNEVRPVGVPGELCVTGVSVGAGYLGNPEATERSFVPNPFEPGNIMYRTGDVCRWRPDGVIDYIGRNDGEVKVRGHRVDLTEIEARIVEHPAVALAAVLLRKDAPGVPRLVAYVEVTAVVETRELRAWCQETLAEYMVPSTYVVMAALPHTMSGKIDRKKLPAPTDSDMDAVEGIREPTNDLEATIAGVWGKVLGLSQVGIDQDFYELGGDSILAIRITAALRQYGNEVSVRQLFENPTVATLAAAIEPGTGMSQVDASPQAPTTGDGDIQTWDARIGQAVARSQPTVKPRTRCQREPGTLLVTGVTGFLGKNLVASLLRDSAATVVCLVRNERGADSSHQISTMARTASALRDAEPDLDVAHYTESGRLKVVAGDLSQDQLGLSTTGWEGLVDSVDAVFHSGAWVHHLHGYQALAATNVGSTSELLRLSAEAGGIPLRFVSTIGSVLYDDGSVVDEDRAEPPSGAGGYEQTKWVAERAVISARDRGVPTQVIRAPWLFASNADGLFNPDDAITLLIRGCLAVAAVPDQLGSAPLISIDHAIAAIRESDLFGDPADTSIYLPSVNVSLSTLFDAITANGVALDVLPIEQWRDRVLNDEENPATAILSDFGLGVGDDSAQALTPFPSVGPVMSPVVPETVEAIRVAMGNMLPRLR